MGDSPVKPLRKRTVLARRLRRDATDAERALWFGLKDRLPGWTFRRQHPIGRRIADFACPQEKLVIELDGGQHGGRQSADEARTAELAAHGYRVLRFWTIDVVGNFEGCAGNSQASARDSPTSPCPLRPRGGGEGISTAPPDPSYSGTALAPTRRLLSRQGPAASRQCHRASRCAARR